MNKIYSQNLVTDSLKNFIETTKEPSKKLNAIFKLNEQNINADSLYKYVLQGETIALQLKNEEDIVNARIYKSLYYARKNNIDSGLSVINNLVNIYKNKKGDEARYLKISFIKAKILDRGNRYTAALAQLYAVVQNAEDIKDTLTTIQAKTGIGWVLIEMEEYKEALRWLYNAKQTSANKKFYNNYGALYSNMASAYNSLKNKDSAIYYINISINDARKNNNLVYLATALSMQAKIFVDNKMYQLAEAPLHEVVTIRKESNDPFYIVFDMSNLASYYSKTNQPQKGITICKEGIIIAKKLGLPSQLMMIYKSLAENYKAAGNDKEYANTLEYIISLKDSFNSINSGKMLSEMHAAYETRKNEKTISEQKLNLTIKNYFLFGSAIFALMAITIAWLAFKNYSRKQKLNMQVAIEKEKIMTVIAVKDAEEHERKRIAADLHDNLGVQANAILYGTELLKQEENKQEDLVDNLHDTAKNMLVTLRETLWAMKSADVNATDVWLRIINFCKQINRYYPLIKIATYGNAPQNFLLNSARGLHTVLIVQEAVNNAARHALASDILVNSSTTAKGWQIEIKDNGQGFDPLLASAKKDSYGLNNIEERSNAAGLKTLVQSKIAEGTNIIILIPAAG